MYVTKQLSVFLENKPGVLARVVESLAKVGINLLAISISDTVDHAVVRMIVSEPAKAVTVLEERNVLVVQSDVLVLALPDKVGQLTTVCQKLATSNINIEYIYGSVPGGHSPGHLVIRTDDTAKAQASLKGVED
ncbi:MAG TPA: ACT domain-containing protein [Planctomycetota bacterium]|nr:ACT domain-containing protein [Planctomycetota bacterium]